MLVWRIETKKKGRRKESRMFSSPLEGREGEGKGQILRKKKEAL